jgi:chemotaxis protein methyltransferase WspC
MTSPMAPILALLRAELGLNSNSIADSSLELGAETLMRGRGLADPADYLRVLRASREALEELVDAVVVPETWFFRDGEPFRFLRDWAARAPAAEWKALSIPCSTGEEPYSIAMALRRAGIPADRMRIDAVDVSRKALERARAALYGRHSFREKSAEDYSAFFTREDRIWKLDDSVVSAVEFHHANALDFCGRARQSGAYQIVFCRNLLIYLDDDARRRLLAGLDHLLAPGGLIFLGHAEMPHVFLPSYKPAAHARSFAAQKPPSPTSAPAPPPPPPPRPAPTPHPSLRPAHGPARLAARELEQRLAQIERQAASRNWSGVEADCRSLLERDVACAQGWFWLGTAALERRRADEAIDHLNRALYLEPYCAPALRRMGDARQLAGKDHLARHYRKLADAAETGS